MYFVTTVLVDPPHKKIRGTELSNDLPQLDLVLTKIEDSLFFLSEKCFRQLRGVKRPLI